MYHDNIVSYYYLSILICIAYAFLRMPTDTDAFTMAFPMSKEAVL